LNDPDLLPTEPVIIKYANPHQEILNAALHALQSGGRRELPAMAGFQQILVMDLAIGHLLPDLAQPTLVCLIIRS
jgi:hypothetical protein